MRVVPTGVGACLLALTLTGLFAAAGQEQATKKDSPSAEEKAARDTLAQFAKGNPGWKVRMEGWGRMMKAGPAAVPVLEEDQKQESPAVQAFAAQALTVIRGPAAVRKTVADYKLSELDSARLGHVAPDFSLTDVSGKVYRL